MDAFITCSLVSPEFIIGGGLTKTRYSDTDGSTGTDYWDDGEGRVIYGDE